MYRVIQSEKDIANLQSDLNSLAQWSDIWQKKFNIDTVEVHCYTVELKQLYLRLVRVPTYVLQGHNLQNKSCHPFLEVTISCILQWSHHLLI